MTIMHAVGVEAGGICMELDGNGMGVKHRGQLGPFYGICEMAESVFPPTTAFLPWWQAFNILLPAANYPCFWLPSTAPSHLQHCHTSKPYNPTTAKQCAHELCLKVKGQ